MLPAIELAAARLLVGHAPESILNETTSLAEWARLLPRSTLLISDPHTVRPIREIEELLRAAAPHWYHQHIAGGGHMAPLAAPELVNPLIAGFLRTGA